MDRGDENGDDDDNGCSKRLESTVVSSTADIRNGTPEAHFARTGDDSVESGCASHLLWSVSAFSLLYCLCRDMVAAMAHDGGAFSKETEAAFSAYE